MKRFYKILFCRILMMIAIAAALFVGGSFITKMVTIYMLGYDFGFWSNGFIGMGIFMDVILAVAVMGTVLSTIFSPIVRDNENRIVEEL